MANLQSNGVLGKGHMASSTHCKVIVTDPKKPAWTRASPMPDDPFSTPASA
jgi:hypothetical protein